VRPARKPAREDAAKCRQSSRCFKRHSCAAMRATSANAAAAMHQSWQRLHERPIGRLYRS
jgi:hypothetical protein